MVQAFGGRLKQQRARVSPKSRLGEKLAYIARHWQGLQLFLADGLDNVSFHDLRHSYASVALAHGETVLTIGRLLGHNDPATTLKYTHLADAAVRNAVEAVSTVLEGRN